MLYLNHNLFIYCKNQNVGKRKVHIFNDQDNKTSKK